MSTYIKKINTKDGPKQIDYNALANKPENLATQEDLMQKADLVDGKVPSEQLPEIDIDPSEAISVHDSTEDAHAELFNLKADLVDGKVPADQLPTLELATTSSNGLMSFEDKAKLDVCSTQQIITHNSTSSLPPVVNGAILVAYDA